MQMETALTKVAIHNYTVSTISAQSTKCNIIFAYIHKIFINLKID